jgi:UDP-glucose 6-dehydrogenase
MVGRHLKGFKLVVNKSTVPVGTADKVRAAVAHELTQRGMPHDLFDVVSNPEFLKEGAAIDDFMRPDRIVVGLDEGPLHARSQRMMGDLYASFNRHHARTVWMDVRSAELTKYAANVGDGTNTFYTITHNLGTRDVIVSVYESTGSYAEVICDVNHATTNTITLLFSVAPTSNQYRVVVHA